MRLQEIIGKINRSDLNSGISNFVLENVAIISFLKLQFTWII